MDHGPLEFEALVAAHVAADRSARARVRRVAQSILEDPAARHDLEGLAERAALSARSLTRLFRRETGATPARFVEEARLRLARHLIDRSGLGLESVAARSGFRNAERMRRAFHRALGVSPRGYASSGSGTILR